MALALVLLVLGVLVSLAGGIWLLVVAFQLKKYIWLPLIIFVPFAGLVFVILNWAKAKKPFFVSLASIPLIVLGYALVLRGMFTVVQGEAFRAAQEAAMAAAAQAAADAGATGSATPARPRPPGPRPASRQIAASAPGAGKANQPAPETAASEPPGDSPAPVDMTPPAAARPATTSSASTRTADSEPQSAPLPTPAPAAAAAAAAAATSEAASKPLTEPAPVAAVMPAARAARLTGPAPATVEFVGLADDRGEVLRYVRLRIVNQADLAVRKVSLALTYLDRWDASLKEWATEYQNPEKKRGEAVAEIVGPKAKTEFLCPAFYMPDTTRKVHVRLREITFADGTIWSPQ
jgi:hypothetical protein